MNAERRLVRRGLLLHSVHRSSFLIHRCVPMNIFPLMFPARSPRHRKRHPVPTAPTPPVGTVSVDSVVVQSEHIVIWRFSADASTDGSGPPQLLVQTSEG